MKRVISLLLALALMLSLSACGNKKTLDFKSVKVIETGDIISLGDKKENIDKILGESTLADRKLGQFVEYNIEGYDKYNYNYNNNGPVIQLTYKDNVLVSMFIPNGTKQPFEFKDFSFDMKAEDIESEYDQPSDTSINLLKFMDKIGKKVVEENAEYFNELICTRDQTAPGKITEYEISTAEYRKAESDAFIEKLKNDAEEWGEILEKQTEKLEEATKNLKKAFS